MHPILASIFESSTGLVLWLLAFFIIFSVLAKLMPCNPGQPFWRKRGSRTDILYWFLMPVATRFVRIMLIGAGVFFIFLGHPADINDYIAHGHGPLAELPLWLQAALIFLVSDVILYWTHRWFHGRAMWRFHAIHHSSPQVDWLSTIRFHPVNSWLSFTMVDTLMLLAGFSVEAVSLMAGFNMIYSAMVHANLNWTFGPFRHVFASPVFHRWHHTAQEEGMDKNFAPTFPLLDILFGTFYMPEGRKPEHYGVPGANIPESFWGQMLWPFKKR